MIPVQYNYFEPIIDYIYLVTITIGQCDGFIKRPDRIYCEINIPVNLKLDSNIILKYFENDFTLTFGSDQPTILKGTFKDSNLGHYIYNLKSRVRFSFTGFEDLTKH